jgi:glycosyltransferase involved in cell wall biosynthesis
VIAWYVLPLLALLRLRVVQSPRRLVSMAAFIHSPAVRRFVNALLRILRTPELEFIVFTDEEARALREQVRIPSELVHRVVWRGRLEPEVRVESDGPPYVFTGGYSNRDYATFFAAVEPVGHRVIAVASGLNKELNPPPNVELRTDVPWDEFERLLAGCQLLVLPLRPGGEASGQSVLQRGMRYLRPVVATRHDALIDHLGADYPGFVPAGNPEALRAAIEAAMTDEGVRSQLVEQVAASRQALAERGEMAREILAILAPREPGEERER